MCEAIKEYYQKTGNKIGFKPAGGINTVNDAIIYYTIVKEVLGEEWLTTGYSAWEQAAWQISYSLISREKK